jgi:dipeptidyl aminopeptidase/acylaminoacyl peptidase
MRRYLFFFFFFISVALNAQKPALNHQVYDAWQSVANKSISNNGIWVSYLQQVQEGDNTLILKETVPSVRSVTIPRGVSIRFSSDNKFAASLMKPFFKDTRLAKIKKKKPADFPRDSLAIIDLTNLKISKIADIKSFSFPKDGNAIIAYLKTTSADTAKQKSTKENPSKAKESNKENTSLVVKNLISGVEQEYKNANEFLFNKNGKLLFFTVSENKTDKSVKPGAFLLNTEKWTLKTLVAQKGTFKNFAFDEEGERIAFVGETDTTKKEIKDYQIYYNSPSIDTAQILVDNDLDGLPKHWGVSSNGRLNFSKDGTKLYFGIATIAKAKDTTAVEFEQAKLDIWNYKDDYLQTVQLQNVNNELKKSFLSVIEIYSADPKVIPLANEKIDDIRLVDEGNAPYALGQSDFGKRIESQWTGQTTKDYYLVSTKDGKSRKIIENLSGYALPSPSGKYIVYFNSDNGNWYSYQIATGKTTPLNTNLSVSFVDEENDTPDRSSAYGIAGWTEDDKSVLLYDRYDIWALSLDGNEKPINITTGFGRSNQITFRIIKTDTEQRFFAKNEKLLLSAFNQTDKSSAFYTKVLNNHKLPELLLTEKAKFSSLEKAKSENAYIFQKESYTSSPDVYFTKDFKNIQKLSNINPQQATYNWGTAELVRWTTPKGYKSEGILYKPEDFDPQKKYPMIVYFYEKLSDGLYSYIAPAPTPSRLNISYFVSNGYLVFAPDIRYEIGHPGKSAEEFINSGVEFLKKNTWVDGSKIGIQGQSWGGYQVAHLITATNLYAAAWAGAPVVNMTSAYGGIRWESGMNRQFQYEKTQSRIGATLWEKPELYIENSPLFHLPKVNTPVVIMANDADGAVPWYQGIEMFTALRRLGKPVWMLNYNNDEHNLMQRPNRKDIQIREQQFFDYYLKGAKAPVWMVDGVPAIEKGKTWGLELSEGKP